MKLSRNVMIDKLLELISDGHHIVRISNVGPVPPKAILYHLADGTIHTLDLEMTKEEYKTTASAMRDWCNILKQLEIVG